MNLWYSRKGGCRRVGGVAGLYGNSSTIWLVGGGGRRGKNNGSSIGKRREEIMRYEREEKTRHKRNRGFRFKKPVILREERDTKTK